MPGPDDLPGDEVYVGVAAVNPYVGAALFVVDAYLKLAELSKDDPVETAIERLASAVAELAALISDLQRQVDELAVRQAADENRARARQLVDITNDLLDMAGELSLAATPRAKALVADKAARRAEIFLNDVDLWNFTDVKLVPQFDRDGNPLPDPRPDLQSPDFKAFPTLATYAMSIAIWLVALDASGVEFLAMKRLHGANLDRHIMAVTGEPGVPPETFSLPREVRKRLEVSIISSHSFAREHVCEYSVMYRNHMDRKSRLIRTYDTRTEGRNDLCQASSEDAEADYQEVLAADPALRTIASLEEMLRRISVTGTLRVAPAGQFPNFQAVASVVYAVTPSLDAHWWRQYMPTAQPQWEGPRTVANWGQYEQVHSGGNNIIYGFLPDGLTLHWWKHVGIGDGTPTWEGPISLSQPGNEREWLDGGVIVPGGDGVLYRIVLRDQLHEGSLAWVRHMDFRTGTGGFAPRSIVATGWGGHRAVFSGGHGVLYSVSHDGVLVWHQHLGHLTGDPSWAAGVTVGQDFGKYVRVFGTDMGVIYGVLSDGHSHVYFHPGWRGGVADLQGPWDAGGVWTDYAALNPVVYGSPAPGGVN